MLVSISKTSFKAGKQLLSIAQFSGGDMFGKTYKLTSKKEASEQYSYYVLAVDPAGMTSPELFKQAEMLYDEFSTKPIKVDEDQSVATEEAVPF